MSEQTERPFIRAEILSICAALLAQFAAIVWWGSSINARVAALESKAIAATHLAEDVARIDERTKSIDESNSRIERQLEALQGKNRP